MLLIAILGLYVRSLLCKWTREKNTEKIPKEIGHPKSNTQENIEKLPDNGEMVMVQKMD
jgi:hypothetical protein